MRGSGEGNVAFAGKETGRGIEAHPARARQVDFGPGVEIGEVAGRTLGAFDGLQVRLELNQIAGDETRGQSEMTQRLHQQPG